MMADSLPPSPHGSRVSLGQVAWLVFRHIEMLCEGEPGVEVPQTYRQIAAAVSSHPKMMAPQVAYLSAARCLRVTRRPKHARGHLYGLPYWTARGRASALRAAFWTRSENLLYDWLLTQNRVVWQSYTEIGMQLGTSRMTVRQAGRALQRRGVLQEHPRRTKGEHRAGFVLTHTQAELAI